MFHIDKAHKPKINCKQISFYSIETLTSFIVRRSEDLWLLAKLASSNIDGIMVIKPQNTDESRLTGHRSLACPASLEGEEVVILLIIYDKIKLSQNLLCYDYLPVIRMNPSSKLLELRTIEWKDSGQIFTIDLVEYSSISLLFC